MFNPFKKSKNIDDDGSHVNQELYRIGHEVPHKLEMYEIKLDKKTGNVKRTRGLSVFKDPNELDKFRGKYNIDYSNDVPFEKDTFEEFSYGIYFGNNTELLEFESYYKGYRLDVYVKIDTNFYNVHVLSIETLKKEFEVENSDYRFYDSEPGAILVKEVLRKDIIETLKDMIEGEIMSKNIINQLKQEGKTHTDEYLLRARDLFFEKLKPISLEDISNIKPIRIFRKINFSEVKSKTNNDGRLLIPIDFNSLALIDNGRLNLSDYYIDYAFYNEGLMPKDKMKITLYDHSWKKDKDPNETMCLNGTLQNDKHEFGSWYAKLEGKIYTKFGIPKRSYFSNFFGANTRLQIKDSENIIQKLGLDPNTDVLAGVSVFVIPSRSSIPDFSKIIGLGIEEIKGFFNFNNIEDKIKN
jgi:hypothetical protein